MSFADFYTGVAGIGKAYEDGLQRNALSALGQQLQGGDLTGAAQTAFGAGDPATGLKLLALGQSQDQARQATAALGGLGAMYGGGFGLDGPQGAPVNGLDAVGSRRAPAAVPSFLDVGSGPQGDYLASLFKRESGNNPTAQASTSGARGLGQFIPSTWNSTARAHPELNLTPVGRGTDGRTDPAQMIAATKALTADNEAILNRARLPVNDATRYALHFLGAGGGPRLVAGAMQNPDAPAASYADPKAVAANRNVFFNRDGSPKTAGQVMVDFARSFGGGGATASRQAAANPSLPQGASGLNPDRVPQVPRQQPVAFADDEAQTQALEQRMGMVPSQTASLDPRADLPAPGAQEAAFVPPPGPGAGASQTLPSSDPNSRASAAAAVPSLNGESSGGRVMTMPGAPSAPPAAPSASSATGAIPSEARAQVSAQAPQHLAQAGMPAQVAAPIGQMAPGSAQRVQYLIRLSSLPGLSDAQAGVVKSLLANELEQTKLPDELKQYMFARSQGFTGSLVDYKNELRKPLTPTIVAPGNAAIAPGERAPFYVNPRAPTSVAAGSTLYDTATNQPIYTAPAREGADEGAKIQAQIEARRQAAPGLGLQEGSPSWRSYVATGKVGADRDMSAGDKKAIDTADNAVLSAQASIGMLEQAKELSAKAYAGPLASERGKAMSLIPGNEAGQATLELDNLVTTNALTNLKSIFGGNPTEGERKILLDVAGSSSMPHAIRVKIYQRAIDAANLRMQQNESRAAQIREGTYYRPGSGPAQPQGAVAGGRGGAPALPPPSPSNRPGASSAADRFGQLVGSGMTKVQAYQQLHSEGY